MFGDRVSVTIDGLGALGGGPNAMDPPLSYASPLLLEHLSLERGIASVSGSSESLGGHLNADYDRGAWAGGRELLVYTGALDTTNTGTPALPMDIAYIDTQRHGAGLLAAAFNAGERGREHSNVDAVFKAGRVIGPQLKVYVEVARKTRAPSYQEAFLWLPLEATGGLADGRSYIGNPRLASEVSQEINLGTDWRGERAWFAPQVFYKRIDGYIQGVPSDNAIANRVAMMMTGAPALEFANTDARLLGMDLAWGVSLGAGLSLEGLLSWVDGKRTDVDDDLYRIAPFNGTVSLVLERPGWQARLEAVAYAKQDAVAAYNDERASAGYALLNARMQWHGRESLRVYASLENLLDKAYRPHLGGINRVMAVDVPVGERLYGVGRNVNVGVGYRW